MEAETRESSVRAFKAYGEPLENVTTFRYLGRVFTVGDNDWVAVVGNLGKARKSWGRLSRILSREGADPKVSGIFYKAVEQAVLLPGDPPCDPMLEAIQGPLTSLPRTATPPVPPPCKNSRHLRICPLSAQNPR